MGFRRRRPSGLSSYDLYARGNHYEAALHEAEFELPQPLRLRQPLVRDGRTDHEVESCMKSSAPIIPRTGRTKSGKSATGVMHDGWRGRLIPHAASLKLPTPSGKYISNPFAISSIGKRDQKSVGFSKKHSLASRAGQFRPPDRHIKRAEYAKESPRTSEFRSTVQEQIRKLDSLTNHTSNDIAAQRKILEAKTGVVAACNARQLIQASPACGRLYGVAAVK
jgi:hypothetical protein